MTTMNFRDGSNVTIRSTDSENLVEVATRIKTLRESNTAASTAHSRAIQAINNDPSLSDQGKKERIDALESTRATERKAGIATEKQIITTKISELERRLDGYVGYTSENIMAFRDAQDRAENIDDPDKAATVMARAIRTNDRTLAHALYRRAVENRWNDASQAFAADNPAVAQLVHDVQKLHELHDASFNRAVAYM
ncbi:MULTISPECIES: hypothetical protein [unclassified Microbacterium]|uniref:hypothetical protein n=1 Tax=unclassified Microbacterium TaxID=2609290 RepID=UPI0016052BAB|nr:MULTISPECIES: hypothetical protein [unclassified Microbacterium]QNA92696.1 hypothetical protein G4G29_10490 [Microbacterium sp. Se63.02b]QYM62830.1 hypothetical protein K1X59_10525 [Microbacterium sp. Se5.02b]